jgi:hypothetical protein
MTENMGKTHVDAEVTRSQAVSLAMMSDEGYQDLVH